MVSAGISEQLLIGAAFGFVLGLLAGPFLRAWLSWREAEAASREADLVRDVLDRMEEPTSSEPGRSLGSTPDPRPRTT